MDSNMSASKFCVIGSSLYCCILAGITVSLQAPFFPKEASRKGLSSSWFGLVFGIYELMAFIVGFPIGYSIHKVGAKFSFVLGAFTLGSSTLLFGSLPYVSDTTTFLVLALLIRMVEAVGAVTVNTSSLTALSILYPDISASLSSWTETFTGVGMMVGPVIGGFLYDYMGFLFTFTVAGSLTLLGMLLIMISLPSGSNSVAGAEQKETLSVTAVMKSPYVWCGIGINALGSIASYGFLDVTLEPHLREVNPSGAFAGLMFLIWSIGYTVALPVWGKLCDRGVSPAILMITGVSSILFGLAFIGPFPWISANPMEVLIIIGLLLVGLGMGGLYLPSLVYMKTVVLRMGYPDDSKTTGTLSGLWFASSSLGGFAGPSVSGIMYDHLGFRLSSFVMIICHIFIILIIAAIEVSSKTKRPLPPSPPRRRTVCSERQRLMSENNIYPIMEEKI